MLLPVSLVRFILQLGVGGTNPASDPLISQENRFSRVTIKKQGQTPPRPRKSHLWRAETAKNGVYGVRRSRNTSFFEKFRSDDGVFSNNK
jgi:hypothetical protein